ncbi:unnamed protein product, partial [Pneumocystis jirovecii]
MDSLSSKLSQIQQKFQIDNISNIISINAKIIKEFEKIIIEFKTFRNDISRIQNSLNEIEKDVNTINSKSIRLLEQITTIYDKKVIVNTKQNLLESLNHHFIVKENDIILLTSILKPIDENFFQVFFKIKQIYIDCQKLLIEEHKKLGIEILEKISKCLDMAFEKLYYVIQQELKSTQYESYEIKDIVKKALYILFEKHDLFNKCLETISEKRQILLSNNFQRALVLGNPLISIYPIEMVAYDPL